MTAAELAELVREMRRLQQEACERGITEMKPGDRTRLLWLENRVDSVCAALLAGGTTDTAADLMRVANASGSL